MNHTKITIIYLLMSALIALLAFYVTSNFIVPIVIFSLFLLDYFFFLSKRIRKYLLRKESAHECYHFINSFLVSLSIKDSLDAAFINATMNPSKNLEAELNSINDLPIEEKLVYLRRYFNLGIYKMFLNVLEVYTTQGGKILTIADALIKETMRVEEVVITTSNFNTRKIIEFFSLWGLTFLILVLLRIGLNEFYTSMISSLSFFIILCIFFIYSLFSIHTFLFQTHLFKLKEDEI